jgi:cytochrome P450
MIQKSNYHQFANNLRRIAPLKLKDSWLISRYEDVKACFANATLFSGERCEDLFKNPELDMTDPRIIYCKTMLEKYFVHMEHGYDEEKRTLIKDAHQFAATELKGELAKRYAEMKEKIQAKDEYDFRLDFVGPIVAHVAMKMLGMENTQNLETKYRNLYHYSERLSILLEPLVFTPEAAIEMAKCILYLQKVGEGYDGVDDNFALEEYDASKYSLLELQQSFDVNTLVYSITNMIASIINVMIEHEDQITDDRIKDAIMEAIRLESPVQAVVRVVTEDCEIAGSKIKKGDSIMLMIGSANRDERIPEFKDGGKFNIDRKRIPLMTFGYGAHACVGKVLALESAYTLIPLLWKDRFFKVKELVWADHVMGYRQMKTYIVENLPQPIMETA